jgi:hypothetical protein
MSVVSLDFLFMASADGDQAISLHDEGMSRRLKALACTAPLHDLDARKVRLDWCEGGGYQMAEIEHARVQQHARDRTRRRPRPPQAGRGIATQGRLNSWQAACYGALAAGDWLRAGGLSY